MEAVREPEKNRVEEEKKEEEEEEEEAEAEVGVEEVCIICQEVVPPKGEHTLMMGCCSTRHHFSCFRSTAWITSGTTVTCPKCSWPSDVPSPDETTRRISEEHLIDGTHRNRKEMDTELISALFRHMLSKAANGGFRSMFNMWTTGNVEYGFRFLAANDVTLNDLLSLNFGIDTIRRHVASNLEQLVSIGFNTHHLKRLEGSLHSLIALYGVNIHTLRAVLGRGALTVTKIIKLKLSAQSMADLGITTHQLCLMGMTKIRIPEFDNVTMQDWVHVLGFRKIPHIRLLRLKEVDFSKLLKGPKVYWNYIGLKNLLGITDEEAAVFGMIDPPSSSSSAPSPAGGGRRKKKKRGGGVSRRTRRDPLKPFDKGEGRGVPPPPGVDMASTKEEGVPLPPHPGYYYNGTMYFSKPPPQHPEISPHSGPFEPYSPLKSPFPGYPPMRPRPPMAKQPKFIVGRPRITHDLKKKKAEESKMKRGGSH